MNKRIFFFNKEEHFHLQDERDGKSITSYYYDKKNSLLIENNSRKITVPFRFDFSFKLFSDLIPEMIDNIKNIVFNNIKLEKIEFEKFPKLESIFFCKTVIRDFKLEKKYNISFADPNDINFTASSIMKKMKEGSLFYEEKKEFLYGINKNVEYKIERKIFSISCNRKKKLRSERIEKFFNSLLVNKGLFENIRILKIKNLKICGFNFCLFLSLKNIILFNSKLAKDNIFPVKKISISKIRR